MKKTACGEALAACMAFPASLPAQAAGTVHGKKVGWIQGKKGRRTTVIHLLCRMYAAKWQLIGKNYYYFDQLGEIDPQQMGWKLSRRRQRSPGKTKWIGKYFCR